MFILIVARNFPKKNEPLGGVFEFDQARALSKFGHKIVLVSLDFRSIRRRRRLGKYWTKVKNIDVLNVSIPLGRVPVKLRLWIGQNLLKVLFSEIVKFHGQPNLVHAHFAEFGYISSILKHIYNIPLIITEHSSKISKNKPDPLTEWLGSETYSKANGIIAVSSNLSANLKNHWGAESKVIPNIVDTSSFSYVGENKYSEKFTFISVGNLIERKGFKLLLDAYKQASFGKDVELLIVGDGPLRKDLEKKIQEYDLIDCVKLKGFLTRTEIAILMKECQAFVLPSRNETFGVVYIEAMLAGLPIIATKCGGPEDFVNSSNGLLIPVGSVEYLTSAMQHLHANFKIYNRKEISINSKRQFSPKTIAKKLNEFYSQFI